MMSLSRSAHCRGVALFMFRPALFLGMDPQEASLLGWLHDFGYIVGDNRDHAHIGGELLREQGYSQWREVFTHGTPEGLTTPLGSLLNIADMSVDGEGRHVGFDGRLTDIRSRYGSDSIQLFECSEMVRLLRSTPEFLLLESSDALPDVVRGEMSDEH